MPPARTTTQSIPFSVADELSCYFDAPAEPCTVHLEVQIPGRLDEAKLRLAVAAALVAQPRALLRRAPATWWRTGREWEQAGRPDSDPVATADWAHEQELDRLRARFLSVSPSLDSSPPLRILLATGPAEERIILNAHHAALDGISCLELLRAVSRHYRAAAAEVPGLPATPAAAPAPPGLTTGPGASPAGAAQAPNAPRLGGWLPRPATRIAADRQGSDQSGSPPGYGLRLLRLPVPAIPGQRHRPHPTVNDLLIAALIVTVGRWNSRHGRSPGRIRITMPVNARLPGQAGAVGNLSRLTAVTALPPASNGDLAKLLDDVVAQTRWAKEHAGPQVDPFSRALALASCPPAVKRQLLRLALRVAGSMLCDTSLVSNLGLIAEPLRFAQAETTGMWFSTSAHMPRGLSVGAISLGGQLYLCLRHRRALFSEPAASEFARAYAAAIGDVCGAARGDDGLAAASRDVTSQGSLA
jgi:NRPS condensation-like uncharacterized protein